MPRTNYQRGYETERKIIDQLTNEGYLVMRSAGSHSKIDVLGMRKDHIIAVQSKRTKKFSMSAYKKEIAAIQEILQEFEFENIDFQLWVWTDFQGFRKWKVNKDEVNELQQNCKM